LCCGTAHEVVAANAGNRRTGAKWTDWASSRSAGIRAGGAAGMAGAQDRRHRAATTAGAGSVTTPTTAGTTSAAIRSADGTRLGWHARLASTRSVSITLASVTTASAATTAHLQQQFFDDSVFSTVGWCCLCLVPGFAFGSDLLTAMSTTNCGPHHRPYRLRRSRDAAGATSCRGSRRRRVLVLCTRPLVWHMSIDIVANCCPFQHGHPRTHTKHGIGIEQLLVGRHVSMRSSRGAPPP
jgi:hypothetical protein